VRRTWSRQRLGSSLIFVLVVLVLVLVVAYAAKYIIDTFFPAPLHMPMLLLVGVILLLVLVWAITGHYGIALR
jgi:hypothetical protein